MGPADLHALVPVLAAEGEKSKTAFYVAGAVLAVWAVAVSVVGITRPDFPQSPMLARAVMGVSALLVLGAVATAVVTASKPVKEAEAHAGTGGEGAAAAGGPLKVAAPADGALKFEQTSLSAKAGSVKIDFDNPAKVEHNVTLERDGKRIAATKTITESEASLATMLKPGSYTFYCSVPGHREAGMKGTLTVR